MNLRKMDMGQLIQDIEGTHKIDHEAVLTVLSKGFRINLATLAKDASYRLPKSDERVFIHPESVLF